MEADLTVIDPKTYTAPWVTPKATIRMVPKTELWENFCAPSDYQNFNTSVFRKAAGAPQK
jgi:hypothetical protein